MNRPTCPPGPGSIIWAGLTLAAVVLAAATTAAPAPPTTAQGGDALVTLGEASAEIRFPTPVRHAIIRQEAGQVRTVYAQGDILFHPKDASRSWTVERVEAEALIIRQGPRGRPQSVRLGSPIPGFPGWLFSGTVLLDQLHYRYKAVGRILHRDRVLVGLEGSRAILEVEVFRPPPAATAALPEGLTPPEGQPSSLTRATLDGELLANVRIREVGPGLYEVNAADVQAVLDNTGHVLSDLEPIVLPTLSLQKGLQYQITSAASDGVLTGQGFTVTAPKLAERAGIQVGDTILSVNGQPVDGFANLYRIFRGVRSDPALRTVQVELERRGTRLTKTYRIR